ncbi:hypothetical protein [Alkalimarinus alittae]|uniref:Uncharacterized protein n=1 Tax=Alkalimarinus alittae TaxID=2961619 RepID=A0ABY6N5C5_9ALTE|nr:hypothetical protein [Alkalimarinus alittae]UZE97291.1 hypothetical protein NKI27_05940 [Alkalimarinus alittae]
MDIDTEVSENNSNMNGELERLHWGDTQLEFPLREVCIDTMFKIRDNWRAHLIELACGNACSEAPTQAEVANYCRYLLSLQRGRVIKISPGSWGLTEDLAMPSSDARVEFIYFPTYIAVSTLVLAWQRYPELSDQLPDFKRQLRQGIKFMLGRRLRGSGYDADRLLVEAIEILALGKVFDFVKQQPTFFPKLTEICDQALIYLQSCPDQLGPEEVNWYFVPYDLRQRAICLLQGGDACKLVALPERLQRYQQATDDWIERLAKRVALDAYEHIQASVQEELFNKLECFQQLYDALPASVVFPSRKLEGMSQAVALETKVALPFGIVVDAQIDIPEPQECIHLEQQDIEERVMAFMRQCIHVFRSDWLPKEVQNRFYAVIPQSITFRGRVAEVYVQAYVKTK